MHFYSFFKLARERIFIKPHNDMICYRNRKYTVCRGVFALASFSPEMLQAGAVKGLRTSPRLGVIFDTISVKARLEQWCRWNCDLRVINARKRAFSVVPKASPWRPNHVTICLLRHSGESLQNGQLELRRRNWYFARETHKDTAVSVWACQAGFWKSTGTSCQLRSKPHGLRNRTHWSARYTNGRDAAQQESQLVWTV